MKQDMENRKPKIAFVCVHNSCRSQMAEALGKAIAADTFISCSAGTEIRNQINPDALRLMKQKYKIDMERTQHPKLLDEVLPVDIVITMGCNVQCPRIPCCFQEDWGLEDPSGKSDEVFLETMAQIERNIKQLRKRIQDEKIDLSKKL